MSSALIVGPVAQPPPLPAEAAAPVLGPARLRACLHRGGLRAGRHPGRRHAATRGEHVRRGQQRSHPPAAAEHKTINVFLD